jgi:hypothetical protein
MTCDNNGHTRTAPEDQETELEPMETETSHTNEQPPNQGIIPEINLRRSARVRNYKILRGIPIEEEAALALTDSTLNDMTLDHDISKPYQPLSALVLEPYIPINYQDAISCPESEKWKAAIADEYASIIENKTWCVEPLPVGRKAIKCKWILDYKPGHKGAEPRYKARLVACGYAQLYGVDYLDTYSPVVKHYSIRLVLAIAAVLDLEMVQLDIKTAFLNGELEEEIFMKQPEGYELPGKEQEVCRLSKCLYGLKQASRCWNTKFDGFIIKFGFTRSQCDPCVYFRIGPDEEYTILIIYVDDGLICSNTPDIIKAILDYLRIHFQVRSLPASRFVGLDISRDRSSRILCINQQDFIIKLLRRYNLTDCKFTSLPANPNNRPSPAMAPKSEEERLQMEKTPLREAIGSLMYLMAMTRPDIALAVNQVAAFVSNPGPGHWEAVKQIFSYLAGTANYGICYGGQRSENESSPLHGFTDANFAGDLIARKSTTGLLFTFHGGPISWGSRRQRATALSTTDAEFYAASEGAREAVWLKALLTELNVKVGQIPIHCDSRCAISIIEDPENHQRVKHIDVKYFFVREQQQIGTILMSSISTHDQLSDMFTKPLGRTDFEKFRERMGIREIKQ